MNEAQPSAPHGFCRCGCGERTKIATRNNTRDGLVKGEPLRFRPGHNTRVAPTCVCDLTGAWVVDEATGCWLWQRGTYEGYGRVRGGRAHRVVYELHRGPIPEGLQLDHLCRVRHCVNPDHLEPVTNAENARRGAKAKLTREAVAEIRHLLARGEHTKTAIATRYGVTRETISHIAHGRLWT